MGRAETEQYTKMYCVNILSRGKLVILHCNKDSKIWNIFILINMDLLHYLSEKHTKFEKIFIMALKNQLTYLVNVKTIRRIFSNYVCFSKSSNFIHVSEIEVLN